MVAEVGQNHSGDIDLALDMIHAAFEAGADAVKFQKRDLDLAIPEEQKGIIRAETPWGPLPYIDYRRKLEFGNVEFDRIAQSCADHGFTWFASAWDIPSLEFLVEYDVPAIKIPSACLTDDALLTAAARTGKPVILSTGMSTAAQIERAVRLVSDIQWAAAGRQVALLWCKSAYPSKPEALNLLSIHTLDAHYGHEAVIGYSSHAVGIWDKLAAAVLGAAIIETHFTMDRASWGTDQSSSIEPAGLARLVRYIRRWEEARGDGVIRVHESEYEPMRKLRTKGKSL